MRGTVYSRVMHKQIKHTLIRQLLGNCLIRVYFICKRRLKASPGPGQSSFSNKHYPDQVICLFRVFFICLCVSKEETFFVVPVQKYIDLISNRDMHYNHIVNQTGGMFKFICKGVKIDRIVRSNKHVFPFLHVFVLQYLRPKKWE